MFNPAIYEFPLNDRMRNFMRLENSFAQIAHFSTRNTIWDDQASLLLLLEVLSSMERHDIKNEISKELERTIGILTNLLDVPSIAHAKLEQTLEDLNTSLDAIQNINGKVIRKLRDDDLLNTIRQRTTIVSGINSFEIPGYYYWLNQAEHVRQVQLDEWLNESVPIANAIDLLLEITRTSADFHAITAMEGFYQTPLHMQYTCQMLRIALPQTAKVFPEASGNKHRVSVRFLTYANTKQRPTQISDNIEFHLSCCGL